MNTPNLTRELAVVPVQRSVFLHVNCEAHASDPRKHVRTLLYMALNCQFGIKTYNCHYYYRSVVLKGRGNIICWNGKGKRITLGHELLHYCLHPHITQFTS